jgi:hypothetical protein
MGGFGVVPPPSPAALELRPPPPDNPLATLAQMGQIQAQRQEMQQRAALAPVQLQTAQLQQQQLQQQITSQRAIANALRDWDPNTPVTSILPAAIKGGAMGNDVLAFQQHIAEMRQKNAAASKEELETSLKKHDELRGTVDSIIQSPPENKQQLWQAYLPRMESELDQTDPRLPPTYPGDELASVIRNSHAAASALSKEALERSQAGEAAQRGKQAGAEAKVKEIQAQVEQAQLDHYHTLIQTPAALAAYVSKSVNPQENPQEFQAALSEAQQQADLKGINAVVEKHGQNIREREKTIATETDPRVLAARTQQSVNTAVATEKAKAALSPDLFAGIIDPAAKSRAISSWDAAEKEYRQKESDAQRLQEFVTAARSGNQAAAGLVPLAEIRQIISQRINQQEIQMAGGGVSVGRKLENFVSSKVQGRPSEDTLNDIDSLSNIMLSAGKRTYSGNMLRLKKLGYKGSLEPDELPTQKPAAGPPPPPKAKTYTQVDIDDAAKQYGLSGAQIEKTFQQKGYKRQ